MLFNQWVHCVFRALNLYLVTLCYNNYSLHTALVSDHLLYQHVLSVWMCSDNNRCQLWYRSCYCSTPGKAGVQVCLHRVEQVIIITKTSTGGKKQSWAREGER